jgi:hypothetical protein
MIPEWLRGALIFDTHNMQAVRYLSMLGLNPLGDVVNPAGGIQGLIRLGQLSPMVQAGLAAWGLNPLTGAPENIDPITSGVIEVNGQYVNVHTGQVYGNVAAASPLTSVARFVGALTREFPEVRIAENWAVGGRPLYPESIPFLAERPMPLAPGTQPQAESPVNVALSMLGVDPKTYNLQNRQLSVLKDIQRAQGTYYRDIAKQKAQGIIP